MNLSLFKKISIGQIVQWQFHVYWNNVYKIVYWNLPFRSLSTINGNVDFLTTTHKRDDQDNFKNIIVVIPWHGTRIWAVYFKLLGYRFRFVLRFTSLRLFKNGKVKIFFGFLPIINLLYWHKARTNVFQGNRTNERVVFILIQLSIDMSKLEHWHYFHQTAFTRSLKWYKKNSRSKSRLSPHHL